MTTNIDFDQIIDAASTSYATFKNIGDRYSGNITEATTRPYYEPGSNTPARFANGDEKLQIVVDLDTGTRVYLKAWGNQRRALVDACKAAGMTANEALSVGNRFDIERIADAPAIPGLENAPWDYKIEISKPGKTADADANADDPWGDGSRVRRNRAGEL